MSRRGREGEWLTDRQCGMNIWLQACGDSIKYEAQPLHWATATTPAESTSSPLPSRTVGSPTCSNEHGFTTLNDRFGYLTAVGCIKYETQPLHKATATASSHEKLHFITLNSANLRCGNYGNNSQAFCIQSIHIKNIRSGGFHPPTPQCQATQKAQLSFSTHPKKKTPSVTF